MPNFVHSGPNALGIRKGGGGNRIVRLVARAIRNAIRANRFTIETPIFRARQADSHESHEFPIRANHATKIVRFCGGETYYRAPPPKPFGRPQKVGFVRSVPVSSKENDMACTGGGANVS